MIVDKIDSVTISFDTGKSFTFYKLKPQVWRVAELNIPKKYWDIDVQIVSGKWKKRALRLNMFDQAIRNQKLKQKGKFSKKSIYLGLLFTNVGLSVTLAGINILVFLPTVAAFPAGAISTNLCLTQACPIPPGLVVANTCGLISIVDLQLEISLRYSSSVGI